MTWLMDLLRVGIIIEIIGLLASNTQLLAESTFDRRVLKGSKAPDAAFPYQVSLIGPYETHSCGGSIINSATILTAAHCVDGFPPSDFSVIIGTNKLNDRGTKHALSSIIIHENYDRNLITNDIALLKLATDITFSPTIGPIELETSDVSGGAAAVLSGWGTSSYPGLTTADLQYIELKTISNSECKLHFKSSSFLVEDFHICTVTKEGEGGCYGETGAPLVAKGRQIGIVSWGSPCTSEDPDVLTRVSFYSEWINANSD